jgi:hypothetical protein
MSVDADEKNLNRQDAKRAKVGREDEVMGRSD